VIVKGTQVYVENRTHVQLPATQESPVGGVLTLEQGWNNLEDERLLDHPVIGRLKKREGSAQKRQNEKAKMSHDVAQGKASALDEQRMTTEHYQADQEEMQAAVEDWNERAQEAADEGVAFTEPHPDPNVQIARTLTAPTHTFSAAGLAQKPTSTKEAKEYRESLPSEGDHRKMSKERADEEEEEGSRRGEQEHHARRVALEDDDKKPAARGSAKTKG
jgi:hypothetical protein